jgi:hypothetical protein
VGQSAPGESFAALDSPVSGTLASVVELALDSNNSASPASLQAGDDKACTARKVSANLVTSARTFKPHADVPTRRVTGPDRILTIRFCDGVDGNVEQSMLNAME